MKFVHYLPPCRLRVERVDGEESLVRLLQGFIEGRCNRTGYEGIIWCNTDLFQRQYQTLQRGMR